MPLWRGQQQVGVWRQPVVAVELPQAHGPVPEQVPQQLVEDVLHYFRCERAAGLHVWPGECLAQVGEVLALARPQHAAKEPAARGALAEAVEAAAVGQPRPAAQPVPA
ncbi:hypothetical protein DEH18_34560 [Streptomyces sp. NHF165]|nr:hypothetical protein DEH18_34560 [Streptomyces sp. NHF165]